MTTSDETKVCARCKERQAIAEFYFVSKKLGTRRGQCKSCMKDVKAMQRDPDWKPTCYKCGTEMERFGQGTRLCSPCFSERYEMGSVAGKPRSVLLLKNCHNCGSVRPRESSTPNTRLCETCRSVPQGRRKTLKTKYNMTPEMERRLIEFQGGGCGICGKRTGRKRLCIDHDHSDPSLVRAALCTRCNNLLGMARDNIEVLLKAASMLADPPAQKLWPDLSANEVANVGYKPLRRGRHLTKNGAADA